MTNMTGNDCPMQSTDIESVEETAALWFERVRASHDDVVLLAEFKLWADADPAHQLAYKKIAQTWHRLQSAEDTPAIMKLRHETLSRVTAKRDKPRLVRSWRPALAAGFMIAAIGAMWGFEAFWNTGIERSTRQITDSTLAPDYHTAVGERLSITLDDGSSLTLNTNSSASVDYTHKQRSVSLHTGQAMFDVAKDASRPFVVTANGRTITALGTAFDVRLDDTDIQVTLLEGRVKVEPKASSESLDQASWKPYELVPGQQLVTTASAELPTVTDTDVEQVVSWQKGQLIFERETLGAAVAEMNRYVQTKIILAGDGLQDLPISGAFNIGQTTNFVEALSAYFPIQVQDSSADEIILAPRQVQ